MKLEVYKVELDGKIVFTGAWGEAKYCWNGQLELLKKGTHPSKELQKIFDKRGDELVMSVIGRAGNENEISNLIQKEAEKVEEVKDEIPLEAKEEIEPEIIEIPKEEKRKRGRRKKNDWEGDNGTAESE